MLDPFDGCLGVLVLGADDDGGKAAGIAKVLPVVEGLELGLIVGFIPGSPGWEEGFDPEVGAGNFAPEEEFAPAVEFAPAIGEEMSSKSFIRSK